MNNLHKFLSYGFLLVIAIAYPVSACYSVSYDCEVGCLNSNLNTTALADNMIKSTGNDYGEYTDRCSITCAEGVQDASWGATHNTPLPVDGFQIGGVEMNYSVLVPVAIIATLLFVGMWYIRRM